MTRVWLRIARVVLVAAGAILLSSLPGAAAAATIAYDVPAGTAGTQGDFGGALGMDFNVLHSVQVIELGVFDDGSNGLSLSLNARLWDRTATGSPLETLAFTPGDPGALVGGSRFKPLATPRILPAGFQGTIVGEGYGATERNGNSGGAAPVWTTNSGGGMLSFVGTGRFGAAGAYPPTPDGGPVNRYAAGTFVFEPLTQPIAYEVYPNTTGNQAFGGSLGMDFVASKPMKITHVGVFDSGQDGLNQPITVRVFARGVGSTPTGFGDDWGVEIYSRTFTGTADTLIGGSRFFELPTPIFLPGGFSGTIVAENYGAAEPNGNLASPTQWTTYGGNGVVSFVGLSRWGNAGQFPTNLGPVVNQFAAGTFRFEEASIAQAGSFAPITVPNGSFELPAYPAPDGFGNTLPGWAPSAGNNAGNWRPPAGRFTEPIPDGQQVAFVNSGALRSSPLAETLQPDTLYVLDVDWGHRTDAAAPVYSMSLLAGGTTLGWVNNANLFNGPSPASGQFETARGYFTVNHNAAVGSALSIDLSGGGVTGQANFDNVRLRKLSGGAIPLYNPSFELDDVPPNDGFRVGAVGWVNSGSAGVFEGAGQITPADGPQSAWLATGSSLTQTLSGVPLEPDHAYVLMADVGDRYSTTFAGYRLELLAGGETVAMDDNSIGVLRFGPNPGESNSTGFMYTTALAILPNSGRFQDLLGEDLGIRLTALSGGDQTYFDNVRLFSYAVPEPSAWVLLALGGLLSLAALRRRR